MTSGCSAFNNSGCNDKEYINLSNNSADLRANMHINYNVKTFQPASLIGPSMTKWGKVPLRIRLCCKVNTNISYLKYAGLGFESFTM